MKQLNERFSERTRQVLNVKQLDERLLEEAQRRANEKRFNEGLSAKARQETIGLYLYEHNIFIPAIPPVEPSGVPLTVDNFGVLINGAIYEADDFEWWNNRGDLRYDDNSLNVIDSEVLPNEIFCFLNIHLCLKFAKQYMAEAKEMLDKITYNEAKRKIGKAIIDFETLYDTGESIKKLQIASATLSAVATECTTFEGFGKLFDKFEDASEAIFLVLKALANKSDEYVSAADFAAL